MLKTNEKPVYVRLSDREAAKQFLMDAETHGFVFSDGTKPTEKMTDFFYVLHPDMTINYLGSVGRMAFQFKANSIICFDYSAVKRAE